MELILVSKRRNKDLRQNSLIKKIRKIVLLNDLQLPTFAPLNFKIK